MAGLQPPADERIWIVSLQARSAAVIADNMVINIVAAPETTVPVATIRIRNHVCLTTEDPNGPTFIGGLVAEAAGSFSRAEAAVDLLANLASPYFQAVALAANAAMTKPRICSPSPHRETPPPKVSSSFRRPLTSARLRP